MKPSDVPDEIASAAHSAYHSSLSPIVQEMWKGALAAVWPLIAKIERDRCFNVLADAMYLDAASIIENMKDSTNV